MSITSILPRSVAAPGAFVGAALVIYAVSPFGAADSQQGDAPAPQEQLVSANIDATEPTKPSLSDQQLAILDQYKWDDWVGNGLGVWISVDEQMFRVIHEKNVVWETQCGTAEKGTGSQMNSNKTPLGWHSVKKKVGDGAPIGQVFRSATPTKEIWKSGQKTKEDLVLTRILWLSGEEPGKNLGGNVDSYSRYIYIHGTNEEEKIGTPSSHGCVRLRNADVIEAFSLVPQGAHILITETKSDQ